MPRQERPLLARQNSDPSSMGDEEEDALLTGRPTHRTADQKRKWRETAAWTWATLSTIIVVALAVAFSREKALADKRKDENRGGAKLPEGKRNLIFMVSDGMGPTSLELTRGFRQYTDALPWDNILTLDQHLIGSSRTRSSNSLITDSAAGATAFSCGFKSYNGAISVFPDHTPCGTVLEAAKRAGYMTGLVVTTAVTDATPACFASHVQTRSYQDLIAEHLLGYYPLGRMVDVIIGGGRCHFLPNTTEGSCRGDGKDLVAMAKNDGWNYIDKMDDFTNLVPEGGVKLPLLALMSDGDIPFEIDRRHITDQYPSQYEMADVALKVLKAATTDSEKGFFIMIEGSRVDHAGHINDPAAQVHEVLMHDKTFNAALEFIKNDATPGVLISTSDHETGGLAAGRQLTSAYPQYLWKPDVLANASHSASTLGYEWQSYLATTEGQHASHKEQFDFVDSIIQSGFGFVATDDEIEAVVRNGDGSDAAAGAVTPKWLFAEMISSRALIGWSTHGHTAVDVNIYGYSSEPITTVAGPASRAPLVGNHENIDIGRFMATYLDVDVPAITAELNQKHVITQPDIGSAGVAVVHTSEDGAGSDGDHHFAWTGPRLTDDRVVGIDGYHAGL